jgi:asparagine synthase (glutamine-hydrolysing)
MLGDFALALWDAIERVLILARDALGTRPLYYREDANAIIWSSELRPLIDLPGRQVSIDEDYIAGFLTSSPELWRTPYTQIRSVQPGFGVIVREIGIQQQCYWSPLPDREVRYPSDAEYEEHFRELLRESVRSRLRSDRPVWAELSGGLDSSSIVCMADDILLEGDATSPKLRTLSYVYEKSPTSDETKFIRIVEEQRKCRGLHLPQDDLLLKIEGPGCCPIVRPNPIHRFSMRHQQVYDQMKETGARILLSGLCGDNLLWSEKQPSPELIDHLKSLKLFVLHKGVRDWCKSLRQSYMEVLWRAALLPLLPATIGRRQHQAHSRLSLFQPGFAQRRSISERLTDLPIPFSPGGGSRRARSEMFFAAIANVSRCYYRDRVPTEYSYPFLHRPLVEFLLAIPMEQLLRPAETRSLQRRALRAMLPEVIAQRGSKRGPNEALCRALNDQWQTISRIVSDARVCARGYIAPKAFSQLANQARHGISGFSSDLTNIFSLELWLRALEQRDRATSEFRLNY